MLEAERRLYTAIQEYQDARYNYIRNLLLFKESLGTLSPDDIELLDRWMVDQGAEPPIYQRKEPESLG